MRKTNMYNYDDETGRCSYVLHRGSNGGGCLVINCSAFEQILLDRV